MAAYDLFMTPLEKIGLRRLRKKLIPKASGEVLEVGPGTGLNLPYYNQKRVTSLIMIDRELKPKSLKKKIEKYSLLHPRLKEENVMALDFPDNRFDTVVFTLVFCTVTDAEKGFKEVQRVLKPEGKIIFIEHVRPDKQPVRKIFDLGTPVWKRVAAGCHLNRETLKKMEALGFHLKIEDHFMNRIFIGGTGSLNKTAP